MTGWWLRHQLCDVGQVTDLQGSGFLPVKQGAEENRAGAPSPGCPSASGELSHIRSGPSLRF